jgi:predicted NAD/FAD-binding protein
LANSIGNPSLQSPPLLGRPGYMQPSNKKIAIIGTGIAGLSAAWTLHKHNDLTIFEANDYIGGHSHTVDVTVDQVRFPVDTGFIVFNPQNYPNLVSLFDHLDVPTTPTDMSFSASMDDRSFEYAGGTNTGLLAQPTNLLRPRFWRMIKDILRFYRASEDLINDPSLINLSLRQLLARDGYSKAFIEDHLAPMGAAIWSSNSQDILDYPALSFLKFFRNHGLTQLSDRPAWRTVTGGSREYVDRLTAEFSDRIYLSTPVASVTKVKQGVEITTQDGSRQSFDEVIFACHSDQALRLIENPTTDQASVLGNLTYCTNEVVLHTDVTSMPKRRAAWASWNYLEAPSGDARTSEAPAVSYWMNQLQQLPVDTPVIVTLNPNRAIDPGKVLGRYEYDHPVFDMASLEARRRVWPLQGRDNMWFCGAYLGDGFHEDGIQAGLAVAELLGGVARPWHVAGQNERVGLKDMLVDVLERAA